MDKDLCEGCLHERVWHEGTIGCNFTEKDRLGFVRDMCECERFQEKAWVDDADYSEPFGSDKDVP